MPMRLQVLAKPTSEMSNCSARTLAGVFQICL